MRSTTKINLTDSDNVTQISQITQIIFLYISSQIKFIDKFANMKIKYRVKICEICEICVRKYEICVRKGEK